VSKRSQIVAAVTAIAAPVVPALAYGLWLRPWHLAWGATTEEASGPMPGDDLLPAPTMVATRAITVHAPPEAIWRWLIQVGQDRGGLYSYDFLENIFGLDMHSADRVVDEWQDLSPGDRVPLSPQRFALLARRVEQPRELVFEFDDGGWTWAFALRPLYPDRTRLVVRNRWTSSHDGIIWKVAMWVIEPVAFVMEQRMLRSLAALAETGEHPPIP
jgi:hypothetical protein